jgi:hypothetical protein
MTLASHETAAALRLMDKGRHDKWSKLLRSQLEGTFVHLQRDAQTEEERRDIRRLWDLLNDICAKHSRRASR